MPGGPRRSEPSWEVAGLGLGTDELDGGLHGVKELRVAEASVHVQHVPMGTDARRGECLCEKET